MKGLVINWLSKPVDNESIAIMSQVAADHPVVISKLESSLYLTTQYFRFLDKNYDSCPSLYMAIGRQYYTLLRDGVYVDRDNSMLRWMKDNCPAIGDVSVILENLKHLVMQASVAKSSENSYYLKNK